MMYESQGHAIDLTQITRLYPAATVDVHGEEAQVSLEWAEMKKDEVNLSGYVLVFDFDPPGEVPDNRIMLRFDTQEALISAMQEVGALLQPTR